ncbi:hypothetical protein AOLI_G00081940 [Acnodon oligacanthus]
MFIGSQPRPALRPQRSTSEVRGRTRSLKGDPKWKDRREQCGGLLIGKGRRAKITCSCRPAGVKGQPSRPPRDRRRVIDGGDYSPPRVFCEESGQERRPGRPKAEWNCHRRTGGVGKAKGSMRGPSPAMLE